MTTEHKKLRKPSEIRRDASGKFAKKETASEILSCADSARVGQWTPEAKARRLAEYERRRAQWAEKHPEPTQPTTDRTEAAIVAPAADSCGSCGIEHCDSHADGSELAGVEQVLCPDHLRCCGECKSYSLVELMLTAAISIGLAAIAAYTLHAHGLI